LNQILSLFAILVLEIYAKVEFDIATLSNIIKELLLTAVYFLYFDHQKCTLFSFLIWYFYFHVLLGNCLMHI